MSLLIKGIFVLGLALVCVIQPWWSKALNKIATFINVVPGNILWGNISYFLVIAAYCLGFHCLVHLLHF